MLKTVVIGASPNPARYSYLATNMLVEKGHETIPVGIREGTIGNLSIVTNKDHIKDVDTVTLYVGPARQEEWLPFIISLSPRRVLFNPGTESSESEALLEKEQILTERVCTLVLLNTNQY